MSTDVDLLGTGPSYSHLRRVIHRGHSTCLLSRLRSIHHDSAWLHKTLPSHPQYSALPIFYNRRTGPWYSVCGPSPAPPLTCYLKSTDGHYHTTGFSLTRLNLNLAVCAGERGGAVVVDATSSGKTFPDSSIALSVWAFVLNQVLASGFTTPPPPFIRYFPSWQPPSVRDAALATAQGVLDTLPLPLRAVIVSTLSPVLKAPLLPLFVCQPPSGGLGGGGGGEGDWEAVWPLAPPSEEATPILFVSVSKRVGPGGDLLSNHHGWTYIQGAGDDAELWATSLSLTPEVFRDNATAFLDCSTGEECAERVRGVTHLLHTKSGRDTASISGGGLVGSLLNPAAIHNLLSSSLCLRGSGFECQEGVVAPPAIRVSVLPTHDVGPVLGEGGDGKEGGTFPNLNGVVVVMIEEMSGEGGLTPAEGDEKFRGVSVGGEKGATLFTLCLPSSRQQNTHCKGVWEKEVFPLLLHALSSTTTESTSTASEGGTILFAYNTPTLAPAAATLVAAALLIQERGRGKTLDKVDIRTALALAALACSSATVDRFFLKQLTRYFLQCVH